MSKLFFTIAFLLLGAISYFGIQTVSAQTLTLQPTTDQFGPFHSDNIPDNGTCGVWANDTFDRYFRVTGNGDGTFTMKEGFRNGSFVTLDAQSPGCAETTSRHGSNINAGINGNMTGDLTEIISNATYNPNGCDNPGNCDTTQGFITNIFGADAIAACPPGAGCFNFEYSSADPSLIYRHWQDKSAVNNVGEQFIGDIATE